MNFKIVIPVYKNKLTNNEKLSVNGVLKFYKPKDVCLLIPRGLEIIDNLPDFDYEEFDKDFFESVQSYNRLMLSKLFYERFSNFDYILIHQLDAFLFKKEIEYWCKKNYDYIGAPWLKSKNLISNIFNRKKIKQREPIFFKVGNGGLSLRKVNTFLSFCENHGDVIKGYENHKLYGIEDVFWSLIAPKHQNFKIPDFKIAVKFAIDRKPDLGMQLTNGELPFGCHGFEKSKTKSFWKKYIKNLS